MSNSISPGPDAPGTLPLGALTPGTLTHCPYCALQCGMALTGSPAGLAVAPRDFPTNRGALCQKGWSSADLLAHPERLLAPLVRDRKGGPLRPATWNEALDLVAGRLRRIRAERGANAVGVFGGGGLTNEKAYLLGKFARVAIGTCHIDYNGRFCMSSAAAAGIRALGIDRGLPFPLADLLDAETILLVGSNAAETMPPVMQYFEEQRRRGGRLIVVDPRRTATADRSTLHLQPVPGADLALANGLLHLAIRDGRIDHEYLAERTIGFDATRRVAAGYWPERVERISGVGSADLETAARMIGEARSAIILTARGAEQHSKGTDTVLAYINLALALGLVGRRASGYGCLTGQGNGQGGREHGQKADQLPGYRRIDCPEHRAHVAAVWGVDPDSLPGPGRSACELFDLLGTEVSALLVMGSNPIVSAPRSGSVRERFDSLDLLVVSDFFMSETAARADVVLPAAQWAEEEGTMTNLEGRVLLRRRASDPPPGVRTDVEIMSGLAERLGCGDRFPSDPRAIFDELRRASAGGPADYAGITYERIEAEEGVFWPCPSLDHPGTPRLFETGFPTGDGRARFHPVEHRPIAEEPDDRYPFFLTTGRIVSQYQSGTQTRRVRRLRDAAPDPFVEIHPIAAQTHGIEDGDSVRIASRRGEAVVRARFTGSIRPDTLFVPFHWGGAGSVNRLTLATLDPISRMPEFKVCAARIERHEPDGARAQEETPLHV